MIYLQPCSKQSKVGSHPKTKHSSIKMQLVSQQSIRFQMQQQVNDSFLDQLYPQFFEDGILCQYCKASEEILKCEILLSQISQKCNKNVCVNCFKRIKDDSCQCGSLYFDHFVKQGKIKTSLKSKNDKFTSQFHKEQKIRKNQYFQHLDYDLVNTLAFLHMNPLPQSSRITYFQMESRVRQILNEKKRKEQIISRQRSTKKKAHFLHRQKYTEEVGINTCGYNHKYDKGIDLVLKSFMTPSQQIFEQIPIKKEFSKQMSTSHDASLNNFELEKKEEQAIAKDTTKK